MKTRINKGSALPIIKRSSSTMEETKEAIPFTSNSRMVSSPVDVHPPTPLTRKHLTETGKFKKIESNSSKLKQPKSNKNSISIFKEAPKEEDFIPNGLRVLQELGGDNYYSRFGISKILKLPITECQDYFQNNEVQIFKCKKVKAVRGKKKVSEDEEMINKLFPEPYDIYLVVTDKAVFTTLDLKNDSTKHEWMYVDSRYTMYDLVKITSLKNSTSVITFYFRTPEFPEYNAELEDTFLEKINDKPAENYIFAHKRKNYIEICVVVMFENSDIAHQCIKKVSHLYKILKHNEASKELNAV